MRSARYKTIPRTIKKVPYGIARQRELLDLVERRFAQAELIRYAVSRARGKRDIATLAADEAVPTTISTSAEENAAAPLAQTTPAEEKPAAAPTAQTDPADAPPSATEPSCQDKSSAALAPSAQKADSVDSASASADASSAISDDTAAPDDTVAAPLRAITVMWHGKEETIEHPEVWLAIFADVSEAGDAITRELVRRRFRDEPYWKTCDALYLSHSAYYHNVREILHYTLACAVSYGILDPRPKHTAESA